MSVVVVVVVVVFVVICTSCAGYGMCKSFFAKLVLSKRIFPRINSFPEPQYGFDNLFDRYLKRLE